MFIPISAAVKQVLERAHQLAAAAGEKFPDSRHLLVILLADETHRSSRILQRLGHGIRSLASDAARLLKVRPAVGTTCGECFQEALYELQTHGAKHLETDHLLISLWTRPHDPAAEFLSERGITVDLVRAEGTDWTSDRGTVSGRESSLATPSWAFTCLVAADGDR